MKSFLSRKLVIGATALMVLGGAGAAVAATQLSGGSGRQAYIDDVATHLNVTPSALTSAMKAAATDRINAAVAAGRLTQAQANELKQRVQQGDGLASFGHRFGGGHLHAGLTAAAQYLGISKTTLRSDLRSGKSLATIASATSGKSVAGLKAAIIRADTTRLDAKVSSGAITGQQEQQRLTRLSSRLDSMLTRTWSGGLRH
jgi:predicted DNA-binding protein (UPF0251 family)